jgi:hypothetical protein
MRLLVMDLEGCMVAVVPPKTYSSSTVVFPPASASVVRLLNKGL